MDLNEIVVFAAVVSEGSFTAAGRKLAMPKSTVSRKVSELEDRLGARLLHRTTRKLNLTDVGRSYYDHARRILEELEAAELAVTHMQDTPRGLLRVSAPTDFAYLRPVMISYLQQYPEVELDMHCSDRVVDLVEEGFDVAIRAGALRDSTLIARSLGSICSLVVASPEFVAAQGKPEKAVDLERMPAIAFSGGATRPGWRLENGDQKVTVTPRARLTVNDFELVRDAAVAGLGVALIAHHVVAADLRAGRLCHLLCDWSSPTTPVHALYPSSRHVSPKLRAFLDHLLAALTPPPWQP